MVEYQAAPLDRTFAAIADPTRRAILAAVSRRPATVGALAEKFPMSLNAVSKHILVLERAGLLTRTVQGREHHLRLNPKPLREATAWLDHYRAFWQTRLDALERHVLARRKKGPHADPESPS
jgi:DNA-binding transcriptional ArsR family regulator